MGMYGMLRRAGAADVARLRAEPALAGSFLYGEPPEEAEVRPPRLLGFVLRLLPGKVTQAVPGTGGWESSPWPPPADGESLDLDKAWHGLHFLLTGSADEVDGPAGYLLSGGEELDDGEDGDPAARLLDAARVRDFAAFLGALGDDEVARRFDPARMTALGIYPEVIWQRPEESDGPRAFVLDAFAELRTFIAAAAERGDAVVVCVR
jgi:hypothetical protein